MEGLLQELQKRDDDATMTLMDVERNVYRINTTLPLSEMGIDGFAVVSAPAAAATTLGSEAVVEEEEENLFNGPGDNMAIAMVKRMFWALALSAFLSLIFGLPLYMWNVPPDALLVILIVASIGMVPSYGFMWLLHARVAHRLYLAAGSYLAWTASLGFMLAAAAGLSRSLAPLQLLSLWWIQYVCISLYLQWLGPTAKAVSIVHASLAMSVGTLVLWGLSIITFMRDHDWIISMVLLVLAMGSLLYAAYEMRMAVRDNRYAGTREDTIASLLNYYVDLPVRWFCAN